MAREKYTDRLIFKGAIENPWEQIPSNALLILPSAIEGCPAVIAEAMRYHIPVFASHVGGIPEMIEESISCFTFDYNSMSVNSSILLVLSWFSLLVERIIPMVT